MKSFVEKLVACERVIDWVDPHDSRLVVATDEPAPNSGGDVREEWDIDECDEEALVAEVKRLLIPDEKLLRGLAQAVFARDAWRHEGRPGYGNVVVTFTDAADWHEVFPTDRTQIFKRKGRRAWAAVGICSDEVGIAVFSKEIDNGGVQARIQQVPDDVLDKILAE